MSIGTRIREAREEAGLTQKQLAIRVGMRQPSLSQLETGESDGTTLIATFARELGVSAYWLETGRGEKLAAAPAPLDRPAKMTLAYEDEIALIDLYRRADERGKLVTVATARREAGRSAAEGSNNG